jgi:nucleotide-binding universal stress UspA family protein
MMPPHTILSAVDFSDASRASLHCSARLAATCGAALHVVHAIDPLLAIAARTRHIDLVADTRTELELFCHNASLPAGVPVTLHPVVGSAAAAICDTAETLGADLIVAGSRGLSGLNRLVMGTTVEHVIRRAHTSVLVVPGRCPADDITEWGPVIAAVDDPERIDGMVVAAGVLARQLAAPLHLVHVVSPIPVSARWKADADALLHARTDEARRALAAAVKRLDRVEPANVHVPNGTVADALAAEAGRHTKTLPVLVMGRAKPGHGPAPGSVASRVIARATAAVLVYLESRESGTARTAS